MNLLSFTVRNHKSIRDEITVDLMRPSLRTLRPPDDDWNAVTYPLVAIFGGNATGKSAILDALRYAFSAIKDSATAWQASKSMHRFPFLLDADMRTASSTYEFDFVHQGRRHRYGFEVDHDGIKREWLRDVPGSRWRTLVERNRDGDVLKLPAKMEVTPRELVLSRALLLPGSPLHSVAQDLTSHFDCILVSDFHREARLSGIADSLAEGAVTFADLETLLRIADIGVVKVGVEEKKLKPGAFPLPQYENLGREGEPPPLMLEISLAQMAQISTGVLDHLAPVARALTFTHQGSSDERPEFSIAEESDGTVAWLAIAVPVLESLRKGGVLLVDEIDASLHPHLLEVILGAYADPLINPNHAQLIFTSHESYILSPLSEVQLEPEQVWFTDKTNDGVTELTCLADFPKHSEANVARRYLMGRYGGTPRLSPSFLAALVGSEER